MTIFDCAKIFLRAATLDGDKSFYSDESYSRHRFFLQRCVTKEVGGAWAWATQATIIRNTDEDDTGIR